MYYRYTIDSIIMIQLHIIYSIVHATCLKAFTVSHRCRHVVQRYLFTCSPIKPVNGLIFRQTKRGCVAGAWDHETEVSPKFL